MQMKKTLSLLLIIAFVFATLVGCNQQGATTTTATTTAAGATTTTATTDATTANDKPVTVSIVVFEQYVPGGIVHPNTGKTSIVVTDIYQEYAKRMPNVTLEFETLQGDTEGYNNYLLRGSSGTLPDISMLDGYWVAAFASQGYTVPMEKVLTNGQLDEYYDAYKAVYKGETHGLVASTAFNGVLWYRESFFEEAGLSGPPKTWDELRDYAKKLTVPGKRVGLAMPLAKSEHTTVCLLGYYWSGQDVFVSPDNEAKFNNETSVDMFNLINGMYTDGSLPKESLTMAYDDAERMFDNGMAAMLQHGSWLCTGWETKAPDFADDIMIAALPANPKTGKTSQNAGGWGYSVTTKDESKYSAIAAWLDIMLFDEKYAKMRIAEAGEIPVTKNLADKIDWLPEKYSAVIAGMLPTSKTRPCTEVYPDASLEYVQALQEVLEGQKTVDQALADAVDRVKKTATDSGWAK